MFGTVNEISDVILTSKVRLTLVPAHQKYYKESNYVLATIEVGH